MKQQLTTKTERVLGVMRVMTWIGFIWLLIEAGTILTTFLDIGIAFLLAFALTAAKAFLFYILIKFLSKVQLRKPFTLEIVRRIQQISFILLVAAALVLTNDAHIGWVNHEYGKNISQVLKRGVELQAENDLTV